MFSRFWEIIMYKKSLFILFLLIAAICSTAKADASPRSAKAKGSKVWTAEEIINERQLNVEDVNKPKYCQGGVFKPCVCPSQVTKAVQYRPAVKECRGNAAIILSRKYLNAYSAVVRDYENKDRWPPQGVNGCSSYERDILGLNKCSVFKVQKVVGVEDENDDAEIQCLGASGYSTLFRRVSRITIKLRDVPNSNADPLERLCLIGPNKPLN
jgi:hypothetical protein